jgi:hypothetical protein
MKKTTYVLWLTGLMLSLSACGDPLDCASRDAKDLVIDIITKRNPYIGKNTENDTYKEEFIYSVNDIRTERIDADVKKHYCAANFNTVRYITFFTEKGKETQRGKLPDDTPLNVRTRAPYFDSSHPVNYTLEMTSEGKLYATLQWQD